MDSVMQSQFSDVSLCAGNRPALKHGSQYIVGTSCWVCDVAQGGLIVASGLTAGQCIFSCELVWLPSVLQCR